MTTQELNERLAMLQEDNRMVDIWVAACGLLSMLMLVLIFWDALP